MVVGSAIFALRPATDDLREFTLSKHSLFDREQRAAVLAFLEAMATFDDFGDLNRCVARSSKRPRAAGPSNDTGARAVRTSRSAWRSRPSPTARGDRGSDVT